MRSFDTVPTHDEDVAYLQQLYAVLEMPDDHITSALPSADAYVRSLLEVHGTAFVSSYEPKLAQEAGVSTDGLGANAIRRQVTSKLKEDLAVAELANGYVDSLIKTGAEDESNAYAYAEALDSSIKYALPRLVEQVRSALVEQRIEDAQNAVAALELFGISCSSPAMLEMPSSPQQQPEVVLQLKKTNHKPIRAGVTASVASVLAVGITMGVAGPAAAETVPNPNTSQPVAAATLSTQELPDQTTQPEIPATQPIETEIPPVPEQIVTVTPVVETPTVTESSPTFIASSTLENVLPEAEKRDPIADALAPVIREQYLKIDAALESNTFNAYSPGEEQFNPFIDGSSKHLSVPLTPTAKKILAAKKAAFEAIYSGDESAITAALQDFTLDVDAESAAALADLIQNDDFVVSGVPLTIDQKIALIQIVQSAHTELQPQVTIAEKKARAQYKAHKAAQDKANENAAKVSKSSAYDELIANALKMPPAENIENYELSEAAIAHIDSLDYNNEQKAFIKRVYPILVRNQDKYKYNAMFVMSMIVQENSMSADNALFEAHNILSIKAPSDYEGDTIEASTWEQYDGSGEITRLKNVRWIRFESDEACIQYFVEHLLGLSAYDDARAFYKSPELFAMGLLNQMNTKNGNVQKGHHMGARAYATALNYAYSGLSIAARDGLASITPKNYQVGYHWDAKTTEGKSIPTMVRGGAFYHTLNTAYANEFTNEREASNMTSAAMAASRILGKRINPVSIKDKASGSSLGDALKAASGLEYRSTKLSAKSFAAAINDAGNVIVVEGKNGSYVIDGATTGDKQGFFVLDPTATPDSLEPWTFAELKEKLGIKSAYVVGKHIYGAQPKQKHAASQFPAFLPDGTDYVSQWDNRWANASYDKPNGEQKTIASSGCSPSTAAWVRRDTGGKPDATPLEIAADNLKNGGRESSHEAFREFAEKYDYEFVDISNLSTKEQIRLITEARKINPKTNRPYGSVVASGQDPSPLDPAPFTSGGHVLGIYKIRKDGKVMVMDPNSLRKSKVWWSQSQLLERANYVYILRPKS